MTDLELISVSSQLFNKWFQYLKKEVSEKRIFFLSNTNKVFCCPNEIKLFKSPTHYIIELVGSTPISKFSELIVRKKVIKTPNTSTHLNGGPTIKNIDKVIPNIISDNAIRIKFSDIELVSINDKVNFESKLKIPINNGQLRGNSNFPLKVKANTDMFSFVNVNIIRADEFRIFYRRLTIALMIKKTTSTIEFQNYLKDLIDNLYPKKDRFLGLHSENESILNFSKELLSLANQNVQETTIDNFIKNHSSYFAKALGYKKVKSQVHLKIINKNGWDKEELIPDYLMLNDTGTYDILDVKLGILKTKSITSGNRSRRKLSDYTNKLISQLNGYRRYFSDDENRNWALNNKEIKINDKVILIGIIGNQNNFYRDEIDEALEAYKDNIILLSYNEVIELLLRN